MHERSSSNSWVTSVTKLTFKLLWSCIQRHTPHVCWAVISERWRSLESPGYQLPFNYRQETLLRKHDRVYSSGHYTESWLQSHHPSAAVFPKNFKAYRKYRIPRLEVVCLFWFLSNWTVVNHGVPANWYVPKLKYLELTNYLLDRSIGHQMKPTQITLDS